MSDQGIFVISDLHMGDGGPRDNFSVGERRKQLVLFLDYVTAQKGELVIVGDLFEFWQVSLSKAIMKNKDLLDRLANMNAVYVLGNHDSDLGAFIGQSFLSHPFFKIMCGPFERTIANKRFRFMHGHEVDPFNSDDAPSWGRMLAIFAGVFEEKNGSPMLADGETVEGALEGFGEALLKFWNWLANKFRKSVTGGVSPSPKHELTPAQNPDRAAEMIQKCYEDRTKLGYDVAIVGHTHQPGRIKGWYFNSGSWVGQTNSFLRIASSGQVEVFDWIDGKPVPNKTELPEPPRAEPK